MAKLIPLRNTDVRIWNKLIIVIIIKKCNLLISFRFENILENVLIQ